MFKETEVSGCHFMGGFSFDADGIVAPAGCELYLAPGSLMRGLYISPIEGSQQTDDTFAIGDVVAMRGQDQLMTVEGYCSECDSVDVVWFAGNDVDGWTLHRDTFDGSMLVNLEDDVDGDD